MRTEWQREALISVLGCEGPDPLKFSDVNRWLKGRLLGPLSLFAPSKDTFQHSQNVGTWAFFRTC
jgi:hypothetical protein